MWATGELLKKALATAAGPASAAVTRQTVLAAYGAVSGETLDGLLPQPITFTANQPCRAGRTATGSTSTRTALPGWSAAHLPELRKHHADRAAAVHCQRDRGRRRLRPRRHRSGADLQDVRHLQLRARRDRDRRRLRLLLPARRARAGLGAVVAVAVGVVGPAAGSGDGADRRRRSRRRRIALQIVGTVGIVLAVQGLATLLYGADTIQRPAVAAQGSDTLPGAGRSYRRPAA